MQVTVVILSAVVATALGLSDTATSCLPPFEDDPEVCKQDRFAKSCECTCNDECRKQEANLKLCCNNMGVTEKCQRICRYSFNKNDLICHADECSNEVSRWMSCAAAGRDNTKCCKAAGIPDDCLLFCRGETPEDMFLSFRYSPCFHNHFPQILQCHRQGLSDREGPRVPVEEKKPVSEIVKQLVKQWCPRKG